MNFYRLIPTEYTNNLFKDGILRLTNLKKWRFDENKAIEDRQEGIFNNKIIDADSGMTCILNDVNNPNNEILGNFYGMSFTMDINLGVCVDFAFDGFYVQNIWAFADIINSHIPCYSGYDFSKCNYVKGGLFQKRISFKENGMISEKGTILLSNAIFNIGIKNAQDPNHLFTKDTYYSDQHEFRIIWQTEKDFGEHLLLKCPNIIPLCNRINGINNFNELYNQVGY